MKHIVQFLLAVAIIVPLTTAAHEGATHSPGGAVRKEQKAWGIAGDAASARRTIDIAMGDDMRFTPDRIEVEKGETVRIVLTNRGKMQHEFVLGTRKELDEHAALMVKFPDMQHDEPYMVHVQPGGTGEVIWTFNRAGEFDFACLIAGHYQAGMIGKVKVVDPQASVADEYTEGEIRRIDKEAGKVTLKHGEIRNLGMPPMAMVFEVRDPKVLERFKVGDKVRFRATHESGKYILRDIEPAN